MHQFRAVTETVADPLAALRQREAELRHQALHDDLTGLANRSLLWDRMEHAIALGERQSNPLALVAIDVRSLRVVNDTMGHQAGDQLLISMGERIRSGVRPADTVARIGGDEFAVLMELVELGGPEALADRLLTSLSASFLVRECKLVVGVSIGIALNLWGEVTPDDLLRVAENALRESKALGRGPVVARHVHARPPLRLITPA